jgi:hypothetical protein
MSPTDRPTLSVAHPGMHPCPTAARRSRVPGRGHHGGMTAQTPPRPLGRALRTVVVPEELDALRGPLTGRYQLPHHLDASARHRYDFADEQWRELAYRTVLMEAGTEADVTDWLDKNALLALWPQLYLPPSVRQAWERRHPQLARAGARPHVPQCSER